MGPLGDGEVEVRVEQRGGEQDGAVTVQVRDSGPGVAPELVDEVFTSGFTTTAAAGGYRGFGLALTRTICVRRCGTVLLATTTERSSRPPLLLAVPEMSR